jgi:hypothetical protein
MEKRKNKKTKKLSIFFILFLILTFFSISLNPLQVQSYDFNKDSGLDTSADSAGFATGTGAKAESVDSIIGLVIFMVLGLVGVIFFGLIILSGLKWMIAQGNEEKVKKAKESIINSLIGLAITLAAYTISYFLINYFT